MLIRPPLSPYIAILKPYISQSEQNISVFAKKVIMHMQD